MNSYPFLDNKLQTLSDAQLGDIVRPTTLSKTRLIDLSSTTPWIPATDLREKLENLLMSGELDSGLPILRCGVLVGIIPAPDLEYALDNLVDEENTLCLMAVDAAAAVVSGGDSDDGSAERVDFTRYIDPVRLQPLPFFLPSFQAVSFLSWYGHRKSVLTMTRQAPIALDIHSPIDLVYQCFAKLGLRYLCVLHNGSYAGLVHKKAFVKFLKENE